MTTTAAEAPSPLAIDRSELRPSARQKPATRDSLTTTQAVIALGVACCVGAGLAIAAVSYLSEPARPRRGDIVVGPLTDMPEIRNGVPELVRKPPARTIAIGSAPAAVPATPQAPAATPPVQMSARPVDPTRVEVAVPPPPAVEPAANVLASAVSEGAKQRSVPPDIAQPLQTGALSAPLEARFVPSAAPAASAAAKPIETPSVVHSPHPLPPPAPTRATQKPPEPSRIVARAKPAPQAPAPVGRTPDAPATLPNSDDEIDVLGLKVPSAGATGRRIREGASALIDSLNPF